MKTWIIIFTLILCCLHITGCSSDTTSINKDEQIELYVQEPLKSVLDSLININSDKEIIQELCIQLYRGSSYRISLISRSYSLDREYGHPTSYIILAGEKIDVYTGYERFFQAKDPIKEKEDIHSENQNTPKYYILEFDWDYTGKIVNLKIQEASHYIPFLEIPHN